MSIESQLITNRAFPPFFKADAPKLLDFFKIYIEWMYTEGNSGYIINNLVSNADIDESVNEFLQKNKDELMNDFPVTIASDLRILLKNIILLYNSKGSKASYEFFFRALFNTEITITYPRENILKTSDGRWSYPIYIKIGGFITSSELQKFINCKIIGKTSGAYCYVDSISMYNFDEEEYKECLLVSKVTGTFTTGEYLKFVDTSSGLDLPYIAILDAYAEGLGQWEGTYGFLSSDKVIQDSYYYQDFSYVITSGITISEYYTILKKMLHPAGLKLFGNFSTVVDAGTVYPLPKNDLVRYWFVKWYQDGLSALALMLLHKTTLKLLQLKNLPEEEIKHFMNIKIEQLFNVVHNFENKMHITTIQQKEQIASLLDNYIAILYKYVYEKIDTNNLEKEMFLYSSNALNFEASMDYTIDTIAQNTNSSSILFFTDEGKQISLKDIDWSTNTFLKTFDTKELTQVSFSPTHFSFYNDRHKNTIDVDSSELFVFSSGIKLTDFSIYNSVLTLSKIYDVVDIYYPTIKERKIATGLTTYSIQTTGLVLVFVEGLLSKNYSQIGNKIELYNTTGKKVEIYVIEGSKKEIPYTGSANIDFSCVNNQLCYYSLS